MRGVARSKPVVKLGLGVFFTGTTPDNMDPTGCLMHHWKFYQKAIKAVRQGHDVKVLAVPEWPSTLELYTNPTQRLQLNISAQIAALGSAETTPQNEPDAAIAAPKAAETTPAETTTPKKFALPSLGNFSLTPKKLSSYEELADF